MNTKKTPGKLRIYLSYANGCGKSFMLLKEALALKARGESVAIVTLNHPSRLGIVDLAQSFDRIPEGCSFDDLMASGYNTLIIDDLALSAPTIAPYAKRFESIQALIQAGKNVLTTLNIQNLDSVSERLHKALKIDIQERVPDEVLTHAESVIFVDISIEELQERLKSGQVFPKDKAEQALFHFFTYENLCLLRKLTLEVVTEDQLRRIDHEKILNTRARDEADPAVLVLISDQEKKEALYEKMIHLAAKKASQLSSHFFVFYHPSKSMFGKSDLQQSEAQLAKLKKTTESLHGKVISANPQFDVANEVGRLCHQEHVRHLFLEKKLFTRFTRLGRKIMRRTRGVELHLID